MKNFLKKYIGIILSGIMIILFILVYILSSTQPILIYIFVDIIAWYISIYLTLILLFFMLKIFLWGFKKVKKWKKI